MKILATSVAALTLIASSATAGSVDLITNPSFLGPSSTTYWAPNLLGSATNSWVTPSTQYNTSFVYVGNSLNATVSQGSGGGTFTMFNSGNSSQGNPKTSNNTTSDVTAAAGNLVNIQTLTATAEAASSGPLSGYSGNFIVADGDSSLNKALTQSISGLTIGHTYELTFAQASGQQSGYGCASGFTHSYCTNEQWQVSLGSDTLTSDLMKNPIGGFTNWEAESMYFTATSTTEILSFLAEGNPDGVPPVVLLANVQMYDTTGRAPEPSTFAIMGLGLVGLGFVRTRLKKRK